MSMTKTQALRTIGASGNRDAQFVLNVIQNQHGNRAVMITGLASLLERGHEVRTAQFDIDVLVIDGERAKWSDLCLA